MKQRTLIELILDRVGNVNIFNLIKEDDIPLPGDFKSIVDDELINEYILSVNKIYQVFLSDVAGNLPAHERLHELEQLGFEFYRQMIPEDIQNYFSKTKNKYLYIRPDNSLSRIPWEILHDGKKFLNQTFYLGRGPKCDFIPKGKRIPSKPIRMLIVIDPTKTLTWADYEAERLSEILQQKFSAAELIIETISEMDISRLKLMNLMRDKDIIHFIGHSVEDENIDSRSGWKIGSEQLLNIREISKSNISPALVFSHSCKSANSIASSFIEAGVKHFIGCRHNVLESKNVIDFTSRFYCSILAGIPIGKAFHDAMLKNKEANLLSLNYVLFSNPKKLVCSSELDSGKKSYLKGEDIIRMYPYPIAEAYRSFMSAEKKKDRSNAFEKLSSLLLEIIRFFSFFVIAELKNHSLFTEKIAENFKKSDLSGWKEFIYQGLSELINLRQDLELPHIASVFYLQKENIEKCLNWEEGYRKKSLSPEETPELIVVYQYLIEQILLDLEFITKYELYHFLDDGLDNVYKVISLKGFEKKELEIELSERYNSGNTLVYDPVEANNVFDLSPFIQIENDDSKICIRMLDGIFKNN